MHIPEGQTAYGRRKPGAAAIFLIGNGLVLAACAGQASEAPQSNGNTYNTPAVAGAATPQTSAEVTAPPSAVPTKEGPVLFAGKCGVVGVRVGQETVTERTITINIANNPDKGKIVTDGNGTRRFPVVVEVANLPGDALDDTDPQKLSQPIGKTTAAVTAPDRQGLANVATAARRTGANEITFYPELNAGSADGLPIYTLEITNLNHDGTPCNSGLTTAFYYNGSLSGVQTTKSGF